MQQPNLLRSHFHGLNCVSFCMHGAIDTLSVYQEHIPCSVMCKIDVEVMYIQGHVSFLHIHSLSTRFVSYHQCTCPSTCLYCPLRHEACIMSFCTFTCQCSVCFLYAVMVQICGLLCLLTVRKYCSLTSVPSEQLLHIQ